MPSDWAIGSLIWPIIVVIAIAIVVSLFRKISDTRRKFQSVAFFQPYCNAGGDCERVLWATIRTLQIKFPDLQYYVYCGDTDASKGQILQKAQQRFGIELDSSNVHFIYLNFRSLLEARNYPRFTMLFQALGRWLLAIEAWLGLVPEVFIDSMGYTLSLPVFRASGCKVLGHLDYRTIACYLLDVVDDSISTDHLLIRSFILYDSLLKKQVFEGYNDICKIFSDFDYPEYDFWYHRFLAGNLDLEYNRSADPKPLKLEEMPVEILCEILEPLDVKTRFIVREVSRKMLAVVDQLKTNYNMIIIECCKDFVKIGVRTDDCSWKKRYSAKSAGRNFMEIALYDLKLVLKPTKIRVKHFQIKSYNLDRLKPIVDLFVSISQRKNAKFYMTTAIITIRQYDVALSLLSVLKPKILEKLRIGDAGLNELFDMNLIKDVEQFKQAKFVDLHSLGHIRTSELELLLNFEGFGVDVESMEPGDVKRLRDNLSSPDNTTFKECFIVSRIPFQNMTEMGRVLGKYDVPNGRDIQMKHRCPIANSEKFLHFVIQDQVIDVAKSGPTPPEDMYGYEEFFDDDEEVLRDDPDSVWGQWRSFNDYYW